MAPALFQGERQSGPFLGGIPFRDATLDGRIMKGELICARCGLLLPQNSSRCDCGFPLEDAPSLDRARFERQFWNLYLFTNAFTAMGLGTILAAVVAPIDWRGVAQGLSGVSGAWAFGSLVGSEGENQACARRRHVELGAVILSISLFL